MAARGKNDGFPQHQNIIYKFAQIGLTVCGLLTNNGAVHEFVINQAGGKITAGALVRFAGLGNAAHD
jgi:hypothetical protein